VLHGVLILAANKKGDRTTNHCPWGSTWAIATGSHPWSHLQGAWVNAAISIDSGWWFGTLIL